jgi:membrane protein YqaA with SNARE-associated domain
MLSGALFFLFVFVLNVVPAFAPPTWMALAFAGLALPAAPPTLLALIAAVAATAGRLTLAKLARVIVRNHLLTDRTRQNIDVIKDRLQDHPAVTFSGILAWAFSPLPSNLLFIACGLTTLRLPPIVLPFFMGRFVSYSFWAFTGSAVANHFALEATDTAQWLGFYFVLSQIMALAAPYVLSKLDWRALLVEKRVKWLRH